jgi:hypothetical protein
MRCVGLHNLAARAQNLVYTLCGKLFVNQLNYQNYKELLLNKNNKNSFLKLALA